MESRRLVLVRIDDIVNILKDYLPEEDVPADAMPTKILASPQHNRKLAIELTSKSFVGDLGEQLVDFQLKRVYGV